MRLPTREEIAAAESELATEFGREVGFDKSKPEESFTRALEIFSDPKFAPKPEMVKALDFQKLISNTDRFKMLIILLQALPGPMAVPILGAAFQLGYVTGYNVGQAEALDLLGNLAAGSDQK